MKKVILASQSPARKMLFEKLGIPFEAIASNFIEDMTLPLSASDLALHLSRGKAAALAEKHPDAVIVAADTFVVFDEKFVGKPKDAEDAKKTLAKLSGRTHIILTGFTIVEGNKKISDVIFTNVTFKVLDQKTIDAYVASGEPLEKAGSYALQGRGSELVEKIEGDRDNIMGLPLTSLTRILNEEFSIITFPKRILPIV